MTWQGKASQANTQHTPTHVLNYDDDAIFNRCSQYSALSFHTSNSSDLNTMGGEPVVDQSQSRDNHIANGSSTSRLQINQKQLTKYVCLYPISNFILNPNHSITRNLNTRIFVTCNSLFQSTLHFNYTFLLPLMQK